MSIARLILPFHSFWIIFEMAKKIISSRKRYPTSVPAMDSSPFKLNLHLGKKNEIPHTARKSILKLAKLPSLVEKYCKIWKIYADEVCKFCIFLHNARKSLNTKWPKFTGSGKALPCATQKYTNLQTSQGYIFRILRLFATKLGNFTNFNMFLPAVVKDLAFCPKMKIQFTRGMVHCIYVLVRFLP